MDIRRIARNDIEDKVWNGCVHFAPNSLPYAYTWYLDQLAPEWEALVMGEYDAVFPMVTGRKWGQSYLYTPHFVQRLGLFARVPNTENLRRRFLEAIPDEYGYIDMTVGPETLVDDPTFTVAHRDNYELDLTPDYTVLREGFSGNVLRNIRKAEKAGLKFTNQLPPERLMAFYREHTAPKVPGFTDFHFHALHRVIYQAQRYGMGGCFGVLTPDDRLIAANFFVFAPHRVINLLPASAPEGRETGAMPFLIDAIIRLNAGQRKVFDFEGSMVDSVARFYLQFGASPESYVHLRRNRLPIPFKWFKPA